MIQHYGTDCKEKNFVLVNKFSISKELFCREMWKLESENNRCVIPSLLFTGSSFATYLYAIYNEIQISIKNIAELAMIYFVFILAIAFVSSLPVAVFIGLSKRNEKIAVSQKAAMIISLVSSPIALYIVFQLLETL